MIVRRQTCEDGTGMNRTEMRMIRGIFEVKLDDRKESEELRELEPVMGTVAKKY